MRFFQYFDRPDRRFGPGHPCEWPWMSAGCPSQLVFSWLVCAEGGQNAQGQKAPKRLKRVLYSGILCPSEAGSSVASRSQLRGAKPGGFQTGGVSLFFSGKILIVSQTLFPIGAFNRARKIERTNRENARKKGKVPKKIESHKGQKKGQKRNKKGTRSPDREPPPPRLAALGSGIWNKTSFGTFWSCSFVITKESKKVTHLKVGSLTGLSGHAKFSLCALSCFY